MAENTNQKFQQGKIYLIPSSLGNKAPLEVLPLSVRKKITEIDHYIVENEKTARRFIRTVVSSKSQPSLKFNLINKFTHDSEIPSFLEPCKEGIDIGILSEAGCPGIADPGAKVVEHAHRIGIKVIPLVGPSSILLTMMSSGMNGQNFAFNGYLPIDKAERKQAIKRLERRSAEEGQAQLFIETPYRNEKLVQDLIQHLHPTTCLCIGCEVTTENEYIRTKTIAEWKKTTLDLHKRPALFIIQKY